MSSYTSRDEAKRNGEAVRGCMERPDAWEVRVWDNAGSWYWELRHGALRLHRSYNAAYRKYPVRYSCLLGDTEKGGGGSPIWYDNQWYEDPNDAVAAQLKLARERLDDLTRIVEDAECVR